MPDETKDKRDKPEKSGKFSEEIEKLSKDLEKNQFPVTQIDKPGGFFDALVKVSVWSIRHLGIYIAALSIFAVAVTKSKEQIEHALGTKNQWIVWAATLTPLVLVLLFSAIPSWLWSCLDCVDR